jgi:hypothetical protein
MNLLPFRLWLVGMTLSYRSQFGDAPSVLVVAVEDGAAAAAAAVAAVVAAGILVKQVLLGNGQPYTPPPPPPPPMMMVPVLFLYNHWVVKTQEEPQCLLLLFWLLLLLLLLVLLLLRLLLGVEELWIGLQYEERFVQYGVLWLCYLVVVLCRGCFLFLSLFPLRLLFTMFLSLVGEVVWNTTHRGVPLVTFFSAIP